MAKTKTRTSLSLSESATAALSDEANKSLIVNQMLEELFAQRNALEIIQNEMRTVSYRKLIEFGVEALKNEALRYKNMRAFADLQKQVALEPVKLARPSFIKSNINKVSTWSELASMLTNNGYNIEDIGVGQLSIGNHPYYYESCQVESATSGAYYISKSGEVVEA